jgi:putative ABC transport system permease protein
MPRSASIEKPGRNLEIPSLFILDENIARMYEAEATREVFTVFSVLAIIIACMGLLGLIYTIQLRIKK